MQKAEEAEAEADKAEKGSPWQSIYACLQLFETLASSFPEQVRPSVGSIDSSSGSVI